MSDALIFPYVTMGCIIGIVSPLFLDYASWCPDDGKPALALIFGLLWPLSLAIGALYALWLVSRSLGRSFIVLWLAWRPVRVPRATARERTL